MAEIQKGMMVVRKTDAKHGYPIFGRVDAVYSTGHAWVGWFRSQNGGSRMGGDGTQHSSIKAASLVELTPDLKAQILETHRQRIEAREHRHWQERIYLCLNVIPQKRYDYDSEGHSSPMPLDPGAVKEGRCWYCKAEVVRRCAVDKCCREATAGQYCSEHQETSV